MIRQWTCLGALNHIINSAAHLADRGEAINQKTMIRKKGDNAPNALKRININVTLITLGDKYHLSTMDLPDKEAATVSTDWIIKGACRRTLFVILIRFFDDNGAAKVAKSYLRDIFGRCRSKRWVFFEIRRSSNVIECRIDGNQC